MRRGRRHDIFDQPWVPIAAVIGVVAVIAIATFFFLGGGSSGGSPAATASPSPSTATAGSSSSGVKASGTLNPSTIKEQPTVTVPVQGVYVKVSYIGSFSGSYGMEGTMVTATNSGERAYEVGNATGPVTASFRKTDSSTKPHELRVEIWKDGKVLKFDSTTAPKGEVTVTQTV